MKRVLMTNLYFAKYTGSELHTLEIAKLFEKKGYEVTIAVFQKAYPLLEKAGSFRVINCLQEALEITEFDIVFMQHYPVFEYLCSHYNLAYKKLVVSKLSVISELEHLPACTPDADLILCVSQECADGVYKEIGQDPRVRIFKNCASEEYFREYPAQKNDALLRKIAVISNHIPKELLELSSVLGNEITVDYIGVEHSPRLVDVQLLKKYDLIITIGRTVQHCFAMGTPIYVYDYFGGPGYINDSNFEIAEINNFSGRGFEKKTVLELKEDIIGNYNKNLSNLSKLNQIAQKEYSYENEFDKIYQDLLGKTDTFEKEKHILCGAEKERMQLYSKVVPLYACPQSYFSQLYIDYSEGFDEKNSIKWEASQNYVIKRKFEIDSSVQGLRFDPCNAPAECCVYQILINGKVKQEYTKKKMVFLDFDPQLMIKLTEQEKNLDKLQVEIIYKFKTISWEKTVDLYKEKINQLEKNRSFSNLKQKVKNKVRSNK